jgi:hypothetical protein
MDKHQKQQLLACGALLLAAASMIFAWWLSLPPKALPADTPPDQFSAERALEHIRVMAVEPHPSSSAANDRVFEYLLETVQNMEVEVEVIDEYHGGGQSIENRRAILAKIPGTDSSGAIAVDAHFDSVPYGPGACDDLGGIGAMLETARALLAGPKLKNDVIFCFADQEEIGGNGAKAFIDHPWFIDVKVLLGLEARGTSGPALMFETADQNGWVVRQMKAAEGVYPRSTSIMFDIYDRLPFGSDFGHYKHHVAGWNVAFVDNFCYYHISLDNAAMANPDSIQHKGCYTLGLTRHCGNLELGNCHAPNATWFNTLGSHMVVYDQKWNWPFAIAALLLFALALGGGWWKGRLHIGGMLAGFGIVTAAALVSALICGGLSYLAFLQFREMALYRNNQYCISFAFMSFAVLLLFAGLARNRIRARDLLAGALFWQVVLLLAMQRFMPGGAYAAVWPLVCGTVYLAALSLAGDEESPGVNAIAWSTLLALPVLMFIAPMLVMFAYTLTVIGGFALMILFIVLLSFLLPQMHLITGRLRWYLPGALFLTGLFLFLTAWLGTLPSPLSPRLNCLSYGMDFDTGKAYWLSGDRKLDDWTRQFFSEDMQKHQIQEFIPGDKNYYWKSEAPVTPFAKPEFKVVNDTIENGRRVVDVHLKMPRYTLDTWIKLVSDTHIHSAEMLGHELKGGGKDWTSRIQTIPREGVDIRFVTEPRKPLTFLIRERTYGVPEFPDVVEPRPAWMATEPNRTLDHRSRPLRSEHTFSTGTFALGTGPTY